MATSILPLSSSLSSLTYSTNNSSKAGIKLAPLIRQASVVSYERRQGKMWFIIHVDPQQFSQLPTCLRRHPYTIARHYDDCVQFCQRLFDAFPCLSSNIGRAGSRTMQQHQHYSYDLPKLKPQGLLNKKQPNGQRRAELDRFVQALFRLPAAITQTLIVLEFFGLQKGDTEQQVLRDKQNLVRQQQAIINSNDYSFFDEHLTDSTSSEAFKWSSRFKTFRGRSPSANSLSSFCTQAAQRLPWSSSTSTTTASMSTTDTMASLLISKKKSYDDPNSIIISPVPGLISCSSSTTSSNSVSTYGSSHQLYQPSSATLPARRRSSTRTSQCSNQSISHSAPSAVRTMKLKVIYDVDNIVVIQIPRSTSLAALRTRLHDKFSTMLDPSLKPLADDFILLLNENTRTSSSSSSELSLDQLQSLSSSPSSPSTLLTSSPSVTLISREQHWEKAMKKWDKLEKVTLRCIH